MNERPTKPASRAVGLRRLMILVDVLKTVPKEPTPKSCGFDFNRWVGNEWNGKNLCGTTACAAGVSCTIPVLRRAGLCLVPTGRLGMKAEPALRHDKSVRRYDALAHVFGLTIREALYLFLPSQGIGYDTTAFGSGLCKFAPAPEATAQEVADHITAFVKWARRNPSKRIGL